MITRGSFPKRINLLGKRALTREADQQRDQRNWNRAAELYQEFLDSVGYNFLTFGYVVQLGNCLKEAGRLEEALAAYDQAIRINSDNSDLHLQRGHLFKLLGDMPEAAWCYQQAYNLDPKNEHARHEIEASGALAVAGIELPAGGAGLHTIWFDVTDFIDYARHNVSLSGIQRVCGNLMLSVQEARIKGYRIVPVLPEYDTGRIFSVSYNTFIELVELFHATHVNRDEILRNVGNVERSKSLASPSAGDIFVIAGAFWIINRYDRVAELRRNGMKFGLFIHDLIQIRNKDYVMPDAVDRFNIQLSDALELCDFVLTNSAYVRDDVKLYLEQTKHLNIPVKEVLLPTELNIVELQNSAAELSDPKLNFVIENDYVLVVSTIEIRKNHKLLIQVWEELRKEMGDKVPYLVFVGKWGWQIDTLHAYIDNQGYEDDWLFIFNGISDVMMETLYKRAMFTVYPSFAEGFGLPIGESLAYGKPCLASNTTAMPEVGREFVRYFDPFDWQTALEAIRRPIVDRADLQAWQDSIANSFKPKSWRDFCDEFYQSAIECAVASSDDPDHALPLLPARQVITGGDHDILVSAAEDRPIITFRAARARNWHGCEHWGVWTSDRRAEIAFRTDLPEGSQAEIFLRLHRPSTSDPDPCAIVDGGAGSTTVTLTQHPTYYRFLGAVGPNGTIHISLLARGKFTPHDPRKIYIGWSGLAYCASGNTADLQETILRLIPR